MIDLEYSRYITELLIDNTLAEGLRSRRFDAKNKMIMYGKEAGTKNKIDRQNHTISNQRPKDKYCGKI